jgi:hypothetical protein
MIHGENNIKGRFKEVFGKRGKIIYSSAKDYAGMKSSLNVSLICILFSKINKIKMRSTSNISQLSSQSPCYPLQFLQNKLPY